MLRHRPVSLLLALALLLTAGCSSTAAKQPEDDKGNPVSAGLFSTVADAPTPTPVPPATLEELLARMTYSDIPTLSPYREAAEYMAYLGVMTGTADGVFSPGQTLNRATAVTTFFRLSGDDEVPYEFAFSDVSSEDWFAQGVTWAVDNDIVQGFEDGAFRPYEALTRAQLAVLLQRYAQARGGYNGICGSMDHFWDAGQVPEYAREALSWATANGIYAPLVSAELSPDSPVNRGELAQVLTAVHYCCTSDPLAGLVVNEQNAMTRSKSQEKHGELQAAVEAAAKKYGSMGIQVAVIENGRVTDAFATGWANRSQVVVWNEADGSQIEVDAGQMTIHHKIRIASISKVVIGMAAMALKERGVIDLDASIGNYWGFTVKNPHSSSPVSVRSLLTHTSSITSYGDNESRLYNPVKKRLASSGTFRNMTPGKVSGWAYNNYAFGVLGMTLELADKRVMDDITGEYFFDPLHIDAAFESGELKNTDLLATLYSRGGGIQRSVQTQKGLKLKGGPGATGQFFAGGLTISAPDLAKLIAMLANDGVYEGQRLLSEESVQTMETSIGTPGGNLFEQCQPLRLQKNIYGRDQLYYHTGSAYGVYNCFSYDPVSKDGVVVLTTGAKSTKDNYGIYAVCGEIMTSVYAAIER